MPLPRRRWTRILLLLGGVGLLLSLLGLGSLAAIVRHPAVEAALASVLVGQLEQATHEEVTLGRARIDLLPPGLTVEGLSIAHHDTGEPLVWVPEARARLGWGPWGIGRVSVHRPRITLALSAEGRLDAFRAPAGEGPPNRPLETLPWGSLAIEDGSFRLGLPRDEGSVRLSGLDLVPTEDHQARLAGRLDVAWRDFSDGADLDWQQVRVGPDRVAVEDLALDLAAVQLAGAAEVALAGPVTASLALESPLATLSPLLSGPRDFEGRAGAEVRISGELADPVATVTLDVTDFAYEAPGKVWPRIRYAVDTVKVQAEARRDGVTVKQLLATWADGRVEAKGKLGPGRDGTWHLEESEIVGTDLSLAALLRAFSAAPNPWVDFRGRAHAELSGPLAPLTLQGPFDVTLADFVVRRGPVDRPESPDVLAIPTARLEGALTLFKDHIVLDAGTFEAPGNAGRVTADIGFGPQGPLDLGFHLTQADLTVLRPLGGSGITGTGSLRGRLWGPFDGLQARGRGQLAGFAVGGIPYADELDAVVASPDMKRLVLTEAEGRVGETRYTGSFSMDFSRDGLPMETRVALGDGRVEDLVGLFVDLGGAVRGRVAEGRLALSGPLNHLDGEAHLELADLDLLGERFPTGQAHGYLDDGTFTLDDLRVRRGRDQGLTLRGSVGRDWALDMLATGELRLESLDTLAGSGVPLAGRATGVVRLDGTLFEPAPHGRLRVWGASVGGRPVPDSEVLAETLDGRLLGHGELLGRSIEADLSMGLWGDQDYTLTATLDSVPVDRLYPVAADGQEVLATLTGEVELYGRLGADPSPPELLVRLPRVVVGWDRHTLINPGGRPWRFRLQNGTWWLEDVALAGQGSVLTLTGDNALGVPLFQGDLDLDADLLRAVVPGLTLAQGRLHGTLFSQGQEGAHVDVTLEAPLVRHEGIPAALEDLDLVAHLTPETWTLLHARADVGGGRLVGDAVRSDRLAQRLDTRVLTPMGIIEADGWVPTRFDLLARAQDVQMQWIEDLPPATGDATLAFDGPPDALLLHADIDITEMAFTERIDWEDWVVALEEDLLVEAPPTDEPPWFGLDLDIRADRTIRLLNNVSDATASADLTLLGDTGRMGLTGRVWVDEGVIFVQDRPFDVERGELRFDDPYAWDPLLDFDLLTEVQSRAQQIQVNYRIAGPYSGWTSTTTSEPRLPQADVNALLWFGVTADDLEDMGELTNAVGLAAVDFLAKDFVQNDYLGLGLKEVGERLPEFDLNTGVNLRGEYSSEPRLLFSQRFTPTLSANVELNLVRDDHLARLDWRADESLILSAWWASRRREGLTLPTNSALGADLRWVAEFD
jgi:hypothetical protein